MAKILSYKDLIVWQKAIDLVIITYKLTKNFPIQEQYCLVSQMRRSAISIPSNIAEGRGRNTSKDFCKYLKISIGSCNELSTQLEISRRLGYVSDFEADKMDSKIIEIVKILFTIIRKLNTNT